VNREGKPTWFNLTITIAIDWRMVMALGALLALLRKK
jgi:hypothetical protein